AHRAPTIRLRPGRRDGHAGAELADDLMSHCQEAGLPPVIIGWATFPTLDMTRADTVQNARKALDHGAFFGSGSITPFDGVSLNISGDRLYQADDMAGAMAEFKKGLQLDPTDANLYNSLGVCYGILEDYPNAFAAFENAMQLSPHDVMAVYNKGYLLLRQGQHTTALACFMEAYAHEPEIFEVVYHIGQAHMALAQADQARPFLEAATRINPRSGPAAALLGRCLDDLGLTRDAIQAYKHAVKINPEDAEVLSRLGQSYRLLGESLDVAAVFCEQSVRLVPDNGQFRVALGEVYLQLERIDEARAEFEAAERLGCPDHPRIEAIQEGRMAAEAG
uniref:tetratricopeptide repeat protein n=1 Tax=Desulfosarcina cetonica TaxID=90730 RepID=UPI0006D246E5